MKEGSMMKGKSIHIALVALLGLAATGASAQQENRHLRQGNSYYDDGDYKKAEIEYIKSIEDAKKPHKGVFNLGNSLYMQNNYKQASAAFDTLRTFRMDDATRAKTYYNLGNSLLKLSADSAHLASQALPASVEAYKQSLRLDPADADAKYNLAYAQKMLKQQQQQQQQQQNNKDDKQDQQQQDQQQQQQENEKEQQRQQENPEQDDQARQDQQQQQQGEPQQISKEDAERILEALKNDEKQTLEKLKQAQIRQTRVIKSEKDW
jgi:cobalamin biosynthesis protein CobT